MSTTPIHPAWQPHDKAWLAARTEQFKHQLQPHFDHVRKLGERHEKANLRYHKALFLKGVILPYDERYIKARGLPSYKNGAWNKRYKPDESALGQPWAKYNEIDLIAYHPEEDTDYFYTLATQYWRRISDVRRFMSNYLFENPTIKNDVDVCLGRTFYIDKYIDANLDVDELFVQGDKSGKKWSYDGLFMTFLRNIECSICVKGNSYGSATKLIFAHRLLKQVLTNVDLDFVYKPKYINEYEYSRADWLSRIMGLLVHRPAESITRTVSNKARRDQLHKELYQFFENGVCAGVDELWAKAKLQPQPKKLYGFRGNPRVVLASKFIPYCETKGE